LEKAMHCELLATSKTKHIGNLQ